MKAIFSILSNTVKGGIFLLFPLVLIIIFLEKIIQILQPLADMISNRLNLESTMFNVPYLISIIIILVLCFTAGVVAKFGAGKFILKWIEEHILSLFPGYQIIKNTLQNTAGLESDKDFPVVFVPIDGWMVAFKVDTLPNGDIVVFVPSAPNSWEGNVVIFEKEQIRESTLTQKDATLMIRRLGVGSSEIFSKHSKK